MSVEGLLCLATGCGLQVSSAPSESQSSKVSGSCPDLESSVWHPQPRRVFFQEPVCNERCLHLLLMNAIRKKSR